MMMEMLIRDAPGREVLCLEHGHFSVCTLKAPRGVHCCP